jgi:hypothetical protein
MALLPRHATHFKKEEGLSHARLTIRRTGGHQMVRGPGVDHAAASVRGRSHSALHASRTPRDLVTASPSPGLLGRVHVDFQCGCHGTARAQSKSLRLMSHTPCLMFDEIYEEHLGLSMADRQASVSLVSTSPSQARQCHAEKIFVAVSLGRRRNTPVRETRN